MGINGRKEARSVLCGARISSTMMVMMTANTPSLNASIRPLVISIFLSERNRKRPEGKREYNQGDDSHNNARTAQRFHALWRWMADLQHDRQQDRVEKPAGTAVPKISN